MRNGDGNAPVVVDTHLWIEFLGNKENRSTQEMRRLIQRESVRLVGPVLYEVLVGIRKEGQRQFVRSKLLSITMLDTVTEIWLRGAELGRLPAVRAREVPLSDILIAAHCEIHNCELFSRDPHFDLFPKLRRYYGEQT